MPLYEFHCAKCRKESEVLVPSTRWEGTRCPHCGSPKLIKQMSTFAWSGGDRPMASACTSRSCGGCHGCGPGGKKSR